MTDKALKTEYVCATSIYECLRKHTAFCLAIDFDQIRHTNLIPVQCCECNKTFLVQYDKIALELFCHKHRSIEVTKEHLAKLQKRLLTIKQRLI